MKFGLIPEFIGRLPVIATLEDLDEAALIQILTEPKNALLKQYQRLFEMENVTLTFTDDALSAVAAPRHPAEDRRARPALDHGSASCSTPCSSCPTCAASKKWRSTPKWSKAGPARSTSTAREGQASASAS